MKDRYLTVTALTRYIKHKIETDRNLKEVYLRGEISNFKHHSRGHMYLTLKDDYARIQAVMFSSYNRYLKFTPENGMNVLIKGEISIYEPHGQYQLYIHDMQPDGIGALYLAYEQLKEKLEKEGLFSEDRKKEIPSYPEHIGIITSPTGAAIRDIFTTINRRFPIVKKTLIPVSVQGEYAAPSIVQAIQKANELNIFDVLIVGRGGGSIEELWSFNEEIVARAIANSDIPIISAVGHETDFTISDFVADLRAPTPTAAAEMAVPSLIELQEKALLLTKRLNRSMVLHIANHREKLKTLTESYAFRSPVQLLRQKEIDLDRLQDQLQKMSLLYVTRKKDSLQFLYRQLSNQHPKRKMEQVHNTVEQLTKQMNRGMQSYLKEKQHLLYHKIEKLSLLNPLETMKRGFTITYNEKNDVVKSVNQVQPGEKINVKLLDGTLDCQVWGIEEEESKNG